MRCDAFSEGGLRENLASRKLDYGLGFSVILFSVSHFHYRVAAVVILILPILACIGRVVFISFSRKMQKVAEFYEQLMLAF